MSSKGVVLRSDVSGQIMMRAYLTGTPDCKLGLNDKVLVNDTPDKQPKKSSSAYNLDVILSKVVLDDIQFHQCVRLGKFESDHSISFIPPDGEFELMKYRSTDNVQLPFKVQAIVTETSKTRVEYKISLKASFTRHLTGQDIVVRIPTPLNTANCTIKVPAGKAKYVPGQNQMVWKYPI